MGCLESTTMIMNAKERKGEKEKEKLYESMKEKDKRSVSVQACQRSSLQAKSNLKNFN